MTDAANPGSEGNAAQIAYWNDRAADSWMALQERLDQTFTQLTATALQAAAPRTGERVIDIGCGCGATVLELARRVGPSGHVQGLDVSIPMAARAKERIAGAGLDHAEVLVTDASTYSFPAAETDLLFSRFGVMFFADPAGAFGNMRRAMRPGGRMLCVVWRPMVENSWFSVPLDAARPLLPPQPTPDPLAPGPFAFSDPDRVRAVMQQAGWRDVDLQKRDVPMPVAGPGQVAEATDFATRVGALARILSELEPDLRPRITDLVQDAMRGHDGPDGITLGAAIWLVSARA